MQAVILAAGRSSRFWPLSEDEHKSLMKIMGKPIIQHTMENLGRAGVDEIIVVGGPDREMEKNLPSEVGGVKVSYVVQEEPKGMGNAVQQAQELLDDQFFVLNPYRKNVPEFLEKMIEKSEETGAEMVLLTTKTDTPWKYGILSIDGDRAHSIVEKPEKEKEPSNNKVVGMYLLPKDFFDYMDQVETHEYQYEDAIQLYMDDNDVRVVKTDKNTSSVKYPWDLFEVTEELMEDMERHISDSARIDDSAKVEGDVWIGEDVRIFENAVVRGPCYIGAGCVIGNNSVVRDYTDLEAGVVVGANSEVRGTIIQEGTKIHQTFMGDSIIGRDSRFGAGCVVANRGKRKDGERPVIKYHLQKKDRTVETGLTRLGVIVGNRAEIGTMVNIMPGIAVGNDAFVGPGTLLRKNVESGKVHYSEYKNKTK